jgi:hypothetical protein
MRMEIRCIKRVKCTHPASDRIACGVPEMPPISVTRIKLPHNKKGFVLREGRAKSPGKKKKRSCVKQGVRTWLCCFICLKTHGRPVILPTE